MAEAACAQIATLIDEAPEVEAEPPLPLLRELPPADPFPISALRGHLGEAALAIRQKIQAPLGMCAQSVLAAATLAAQGHVDIVLPHGQARPVSCDFLSIAESGERKTTCDQEALKPVREREAELRALCREEMTRYRDKSDVYEAERKKAMKGGNRNDIENDLRALGSKPEEPLEPILICSEPTLEGLHKLLERGQPSLGVFSAEGGQFFGGYGMSRENKKRTAGGFSELWDGEPLTRVRAGDGNSVLAGRRVSMHLMVQPGIAADVLSDHLLADQGFLSRVLICFPASSMGTRLWQAPAPESEAALARYGRIMGEILARPLPLMPGTRNELNPRRLMLGDEARELWVRYADDVEVRLASGREFEPIRGLANKLPEHAARLAAVLCFVGNQEAEAVGPEAMAAGIELANYYAAEAIRLHMGGKDDPQLKEAEKLRQWCLRQPGGLVAFRDICRGGPNSIRSAATARPLVDILVNHRWLVPVEGGAKINGQQRREVYRVIRETE